MEKGNEIDQHDDSEASGDAPKCRYCGEKRWPDENPCKYCGMN